MKADPISEFQHVSFQHFPPSSIFHLPPALYFSISAFSPYPPPLPLKNHRTGTISCCGNICRPAPRPFHPPPRPPRATERYTAPLRPACCSLPAARFRHSAELHGATRVVGLSASCYSEPNAALVASGLAHGTRLTGHARSRLTINGSCPRL
jgi:hypothetical protein